MCRFLGLTMYRTTLVDLILRYPGTFWRVLKKPHQQAFNDRFRLFSSIKVSKYALETEERLGKLVDVVQAEIQRTREAINAAVKEVLLRVLAGKDINGQTESARSIKFGTRPNTPEKKQGSLLRRETCLRHSYQPNQALRHRR